MAKKTNFEEYYDRLSADPVMAGLLEEADKAWDIAVQVRQLRKGAGLTQDQLARKVGTSQQAIARIEKAGYENVRLDTLRKVAGALHAKVAVRLVPARAAGRKSRRHAV